MKFRKEHNKTFKHHNREGIINWLKKQQYATSGDDVDLHEYEMLLNDFCLSQEGFDPLKAKGTSSFESYVQNRWKAFTKFAHSKYKKPKKFKL